jgi:hypothetical protein
VLKRRVASVIAAAAIGVEHRAARKTVAISKENSYGRDPGGGELDGEAQTAAQLVLGQAGDRRR